MKSEICAIFAIGPDNVIGIGDKMPWHSKQDFYHYKTITKGYPCIFGDRTFFGLPEHPLRDRLNIVTAFSYKEVKIINTMETKDGKPELKGSYIEVPSIETGIELCGNYSKVFVCGGSSIYKYCLENNLIDSIYLTTVESKSLEMDILKDPDKYIRFPIDIFNFLITNNWVSKEITYETLPEENSDIKVKFTKWIKS